ncbi:hypothetical protein [Saccharopolyspora cebuensis]|uniref:NADPH-dependent reductive aminase-like C-terminal domain-containing protein n=1 Tax=Saccharopolyspora cebuensis TaxID=418759 RepID=A0ABV4CRQ0_9PSEU
MRRRLLVDLVALPFDTRAQLMYQAQLDVFLTTLSSLMHATALLGSAGLTAREVFADLVGMVAATPSIIGAAGDLAAQLDAGEHPGHLSTATMMGATTDHIVAASESAGIDLALPRAVQSHYRRVIEDGRGGDNWTRILDAIRDR